MLIKTIEVGFLQTNCYLVTDEATLDTAIIDPGADSNRILDYVEKNRLAVRAILLTHGHFDHCMGLEEVQGALGVPVYMSREDLGREIGNGDWVFDPRRIPALWGKGTRSRRGPWPSRYWKHRGIPPAAWFTG